MTARNHVEAMRSRARRPTKVKWETQMALAGHNVTEAALVLLRRLRGSIDAGELTISGSEDMADAVRDALDRLERSAKVFDSLKKNPPHHGAMSRKVVPTDSATEGSHK